MPQTRFGVITAPKDAQTRVLLARMLEEAWERLVRAPPRRKVAAQSSVFILNLLFKDGEADVREIAFELEKIYGQFFNPVGFLRTCARIQHRLNPNTALATLGPTFLGKQDEEEF